MFVEKKEQRAWTGVVGVAVMTNVIVSDRKYLSSMDNDNTFFPIYARIGLISLNAAWNLSYSEQQGQYEPPQGHVWLQDQTREIPHQTGCFPETPNNKDPVHSRKRRLRL